MKTFMFLHFIGQKILENLNQHFDEVGLSTHTHGNVKCLPNNALTFEDANRLTTFVANYARTDGLPFPGHLPGHQDRAVVLSSDVTNVFVYSKYRAACNKNGWVPAGRSKFYTIW